MNNCHPARKKIKYFHKVILARRGDLKVICFEKSKTGPIEVKIVCYY
jgi:hypothetical protein